MDVDSFSPGQESCRKARPRLTDLTGAARQAPNGVAFSLATFSWPRKRKLLALRRRVKALINLGVRCVTHSYKNSSALSPPTFSREERGKDNQLRRVLDAPSFRVNVLRPMPSASAAF